MPYENTQLHKAEATKKRLADLVLPRFVLHQNKELAMTKKTILVTGATDGIGLATSKRFRMNKVIIACLLPALERHNCSMWRKIAGKR